MVIYAAAPGQASQTVVFCCYRALGIMNFDVLSIYIVCIPGPKGQEIFLHAAASCLFLLHLQRGNNRGT